MYEIARVTLENEMDLILAHRRSMKLGELTGLSLSAQTTFATAVSEVARNTIESGKSGCLILNIEFDNRNKYIVACIKDEQAFNQKSREGLEYAKRLVNKYNIFTQDDQTSIELYYYINPAFKIDIHKLDEWRRYFRNEPPVTAYEELKRKNEQLQDLSEKLKKSEAQYKTLTNSLPLLIFSLDRQGNILYANEGLTDFSGESIESLNRNQWKKMIHPDDYESFSVLIKNDLARATSVVRMQVRLVPGNGEFLWHQVSLSPISNEKDDSLYWIGFMADIHAQKLFEETLKDNYDLKQTQRKLKENQQMLESYIEELNRSNAELQQFAFVASHDLQEPVRKLLFYSDFLINQFSDVLKGKGLDYLKGIQHSSQRMRILIKDLLIFSQIKKEELKFTSVDLNTVASEAFQNFEMMIEEKGAKFEVENLPTIESDERMMSQLFENIISNSLKYTKPDGVPVIKISCQKKDGLIELRFQDNGIGFDEKYLPQMFVLFQRLHDRSQYEGTGLGLAICKKIVDIHKGTIWANSKEGEGATFHISLPVESVTG
jgi:PAS domain S-box-containing protein